MLPSSQPLEKTGSDKACLRLLMGAVISLLLEQVWVLGWVPRARRCLLPAAGRCPCWWLQGDCWREDTAVCTTGCHETTWKCLFHKDCKMSQTLGSLKYFHTFRATFSGKHWSHWIHLPLYHNAPFVINVLICGCAISWCKQKSIIDTLRMKWQFISLHMVYNLFHAAQRVVWAYCPLLITIYRGENWRQPQS